MGMFSKEQMNHALLGMYVGTRGPRTLRKCILDKLFTYRMYRNEETIREHLDADMILLAFPEGQSVPSLDDLDDLVIPDIGQLAFGVSKNDQDISKLRISIQTNLEGPVFKEYLQSRKHRFLKKNSSKRLLSKSQLAKLYPVTGDSSIFDLDVTVLGYILFEGMDFTPVTDFDKLPSESVITEADDMLRIKICRNILVHQPVAEISDKDFETYWECLTGAFERLLKSACVRRESERLKSLRLSDEKIDQFKVMIQEWRMDEQDIRTEQLGQIKDIVTQSGSETETVIKATGTKIVEHLDKKHEQLVSLLRKNHSKCRKVQKELKKSFPLRIIGHDKFKQVCHFMENQGISYSMPTASSSDSSPTFGSPRNSQDMDPMFPQLHSDMEDNIDPIPNGLDDRPYKGSPLLYNGNECRIRDMEHNNIDSATGIAKHPSKETAVKENSQWKRTARTKRMYTTRKRSSWPASYEVRYNPEYINNESESTDDDPIRQDVRKGIGQNTSLSEKLKCNPEYFSNVSESTDDDPIQQDVLKAIGEKSSLSEMLKETAVKENSQWKRTARTKRMNTTRKRSSWPASYNIRYNPEYLNNESESTDDDPIRQDVPKAIGENSSLSEMLKLNMTPSQNGLYSGDSTGYNSDLISLSSVDGNTSDSLFHPHRQHVPILCGTSEMTSEDDENYFDNPFQLNALDDGYTSYGNASSLDRSLSISRYRYRSRTPLLPDSEAGFVADRKNKDCRNKEMTDIGEIGTDSKFESLLVSESEEKQEKKSDVNQEIPFHDVKMSTHPLKRFVGCCSDKSTDISGPGVFVPVPITQLLRKSSQTKNTFDDSGEEQQEIFV